MYILSKVDNNKLVDVGTIKIVRNLKRIIINLS